jgi:hypothetical protein
MNDMDLLVLAYLDPTAGSLWLQTVLGTLFGGLILAGQYWARLRAFALRLARRRRSF